MNFILGKRAVKVAKSSVVMGDHMRDCLSELFVVTFCLSFVI